MKSHADVETPLTTAVDLGEQMIDAGFCWPSYSEAIDAVIAELRELVAELGADTPDPERIASELGDVAFTVGILGAHVRREVTALRTLEIDTALSQTLAKFRRRFCRMTQLIEEDCKSYRLTSAPRTRAEWTPYWEKAKRELG